MKKLTALLLVLIVIFSMTIIASAENTDNVTASSSTTNVVLKKLYTITGASSANGTDAAAVYPHETLTFVSTPDASNPTTQNLTIAPLSVSGPNGTMSITLPGYTKIGKYVYTVSETAGNAQAATYAADPITLTVLVTYNNDHTALVAELYLTQKTAGNGTQTSQIQVSTGNVAKVDTFVNTYEVGHLNVSNTVTGNLASKETEFEMTVTFTSAKPVLSDITVYDGSTNTASTIAYGTGWTTKTATINVKNGETVSFYNIPAGVTYVVEEAAKHGVGSDGFDANSAADTDYTITYDSNKTGTIAVNSALNTTVTNEKKTNVETGIELDSAPYILMLAVAVMGMVVILGKKHYEI